MKIQSEKISQFIGTTRTTSPVVKYCYSIIENLISRKIKIKAIQGRFEELSSLCRECSTRKKLIKFNLFQKFEHVKISFNVEIKLMKVLSLFG